MRLFGLNRDYGSAVMIAILILAVCFFCLASVAVGAYGYSRYGPKPEPIVIKERVLVPIAASTVHWACTRQEAKEYLFACRSRERMSKVEQTTNGGVK